MLFKPSIIDHDIIVRDYLDRTCLVIVPVTFCLVYQACCLGYLSESLDNVLKTGENETIYLVSLPVTICLVHQDLKRDLLSGFPS